ncbi:phosphate-starvation-inducible PsiE family protein [Spongorhabdus nitratireducens]
MVNFLKKFERYIAICLAVLMVIVVLLATIDLAWAIIRDVLSPPVLLLGVDEIFDIFGLFLIILIGVELLETIKAYIIEQVFHVEIVLEVALIAVAKKVIVLDLEKYDSGQLMALALLILAVSIGYYLIKRFVCAVPKTEELDQQ